MAGIWEQTMIKSRYSTAESHNQNCSRESLTLGDKLPFAVDRKIGKKSKKSKSQMPRHQITLMVKKVIATENIRVFHTRNANASTLLRKLTPVRGAHRQND